MYGHTYCTYLLIYQISKNAEIEVREDYHVGSWKTLREDVRHHLAEARAM